MKESPTYKNANSDRENGRDLIWTKRPDGLRCTVFCFRMTIVSQFRVSIPLPSQRRQIALNVYLDYVEGEAHSASFSNYGEFLRRELPPLVRRELDSMIHGTLEDQLKEKIVEMVQSL